MENKIRKMKMNLILIIIIGLFFCISLISADDINTTYYSADSIHTGSATSENSSTSSYEFTYTTTYQQPGNRDTATESYSANIGWLNNSEYINNDTLQLGAVCDANNLNLCISSNACVGAGGYWYNGVCNAEEEAIAIQETPGGITGKIIREIEKEKIEEGIIKGIKEFEKIKFSFTEGELEHTHYIEALDIKEDSVLIVIYPDENRGEHIKIANRSKSITGEIVYTAPEIEFEEPITFRLYLKEAKQLDLTGNGYRDIYIKLEEIKNSEAFIYIELIYEFIDEEDKITKETALDYIGKKVFLWTLIILFLIFGLILFLCYRKKGRKKKKRIEFKISFKFALLGLGIAILLTVLVIMRASITGFVIGAEKVIESLFGVFFLCFIIGGLGLVIFLHRKNIRRVIEAKKRNKHATNSLKGLIKKKVYTNDGESVGKVEEIILGENKIHSLKIKLDKKFKGKGKGIIAKYKGIRDVGHIVIVDDKIIEKIEK